MPSPKKEGDKPKGKNIKLRSDDRRGGPVGNQKAIGNKGGGRPSLYKPEYPEMARKIALLGATEAEFADIVGVAESTVSLWKKDHPEFAEAFEKGKLVADAEVAASVYKRATGYEQEAVKIFMPAGFSEPVYAPYTERIAPDTGAAAFWLKNRRRTQWKDKHDHEVTGKDGAPIQVESTMSPKAAAEAYAVLLKENG